MPEVGYRYERLVGKKVKKGKGLKKGKLKVESSVFRARKIIKKRKKKVEDMLKALEK